MENFEAKPEFHRITASQQRSEEGSQMEHSKGSQDTTSALEALLEDVYINDASSAKVGNFYIILLPNFVLIKKLA